MSSITSHFRDINLSEKLHQVLDTAAQYVKNPTTGKMANVVGILGAATSLGGAIDFARGNKKRGALVALTGAAGVASSIASSYFLKPTLTVRPFPINTFLTFYTIIA